MKTLTEFAGVQVRMAAAAIAEARRSLPAEEDTPAEAAVVGATSQAVPEATAQDAGGDLEVGTALTSAGASTPAPDLTPAPARQAESEAVTIALEAAVAKATGLSGDRVAMLREAVEVVGARAADVRVVRVFGADEQPPGAMSLGGHQFVVDYFPASMKQVAGSPKGERGARRGGGGRGGGGGGGGRGASPGGTGGFSMDALRDDRKSERGAGRPGGGRRPGGAPGGKR